MNEKINEERSKIFSYKNGEKFKVAILRINEDIGFYEFLQKMKKNNLNQFIVTSFLMLKIMQEFFIEEQYDIVDIEFSFGKIAAISENEIDQLIKESNKKREKFFYLIEKIYLLYNEQFLDILSITMKKPENKEVFKVFSSGVIIIDKNDKNKTEIFEKMNLLLTKIINNTK